MYWPDQSSISWALETGIIDRSTPKHNGIRIEKKRKIFEWRLTGKWRRPGHSNYLTVQLQSEQVGGCWFSGSTANQ